MKKILMFLCFGSVLMLLCGCMSDSDEVSATDITLQELEARMNQATDPEGNFSGSNSYVMRQEIYEKQFLDDDIEEMVEVKFMRPDNFAIITYQDNKPAGMFCTNGDEGWIADYSSRRIKLLDDESLQRMQMLASLGKPGSGGYEAVFAKVELFRCSNSHGDFYRVDCYAAEGSDPVHFYIDAETFLLRRVKMRLSIGVGSSYEYDAVIQDYEWREGVMIPMETVVTQLGVTQESKVIFYQLNPVLGESDFLPPVFQ